MEKRSTKNMEFFRHVNGPGVLVLAKEYGQPVLYLNTDAMRDRFFQCVTQYFEGSWEFHTLNFEDPHHHWTGEITRSGSTILYGGMAFRLVDGPPQISVVPLAETRQPWFIYRQQNGQMIYLSLNDKNGDLHVFIGSQEKLRRVAVEGWEMSSHGNADVFITEQGNLSIPTSYRHNKTAFWNGEPLEKVDPTQFDIMETPSTVTLTPKYEPS